MKQLLAEIQDWQFAKKWIAENENGPPEFDEPGARPSASTRSSGSAPSCAR